MPETRTGRPTVGTADVVVVGAGPAGLAAAAAALDAGAEVVLVDGEARPGGQYWRHGPGGLARDRAGAGSYAQLVAAPGARGDRLTRLPGHRVWRVDAVPGDDGTGDGGVGIAAVVHAVRGGPGREEPATLHARALVLAPGAHDRVLPFPGWDLPGVVTAGAAQAMLEEHGVPVGKRVVVAGTGPFLLPVAAGLARHARPPVAVLEAGDGRGWMRGPAVLARSPGRVGEGARHLAVLARHGVRLRLRHAVVAAHGTDRVEAVTIARLDPRWRVVPGSLRRLSCDAAAVGWGFTGRLDLPLQAGCAAEPGPDGELRVAVDVWGRTSVPGVLAAGEVTGVGGAALAVQEGSLAGQAAAAHAGGRRLGLPLSRQAREVQRLRAFAALVQSAHPVRPGWQTWLDDDTVVCRCEEVPLGDLRQAVLDLGATDARTAKLLTRCGMGWCQGRMCTRAVEDLVAGITGAAGPVGTAAGAARPVAVPVSLGVVALGAEVIDPPAGTPAGHEHEEDTWTQR